MKHYIISLFMLVAMTVTASAQTKIESVEDISFKADITSIMPTKWGSENSLTGFSFEMRGDTVKLLLPYVGEVYNPTFNDDGLDFTEVCKDVKIKNKKKKSYDRTDIEFTLRHDIVNYEFTVTLYDNEKVDIYMRPSNAESCNYSGNILNE